MAKRNMFVGMDVHKESIDIALAEEGGTARCATTEVSRVIWRRSPRRCGRESVEHAEAER